MLTSDDDRLFAQYLDALLAQRRAHQRLVAVDASAHVCGVEDLPGYLVQWHECGDVEEAAEDAQGRACVGHRIRTITGEWSDGPPRTLLYLVRVLDGPHADLELWVEAGEVLLLRDILPARE